MAYVNVSAGIVAGSMLLVKTYSSSSGGAGEPGIGVCDYSFRWHTDAAVPRSDITRCAANAIARALSMPLVIEAAAVGDPVVL